MIQYIKDLVKYYLATLGYYGAYEVTGATATSDEIFCVKAIGGDAAVTTVAKAGSNLSVTIGDGDVLYGSYSSITVTSGTALVYPLSTSVTIA